MKDKTRSLLEQAIDDICRQEMSPEQINESVGRIRAQLRQAGEGVTAQQMRPSASPAPDRAIRGCADFQALIPAYLARSLSEARTLLVEDHARGCVACRRALHAARYGPERADAPVRILPKRRRNWTLALGGAVAAAIVALIVIGGMEGVLPGFNRFGGRLARVESLHGALYIVSGQTMRAVAPGAELRSGEEIRVAPGSTSAIRLTSGSRVEMSARADVAVTRGWLGTTIRLVQGGIIVEASRRDSGRLSVETRDCLVSDRGTIFAVTQGVKGSRVAVIQGEVRVKQGRHLALVHAGGQFSTSDSLSSMPIGEQIAWSHDAAHYLALLGEFAGIGRELQSMPGPAPRFSSALIRYVPANTVIYAAIPNLESTLSEVNELFEDRLAKSPLLEAWWQKQQASGCAQAAEEIVQRIQASSSYLGNELVFSAVQSTGSRKLSPLVLAKVEKPGFSAFLEQQLNGINGQIGQRAFRIVNNASDLPAAANHERVMVLLKGNVMAISADPEALREVATLIAAGPASVARGFAGTDFYSAIQQSYRSGAGWLLAVDLEQIAAPAVHKKQLAAVAGGAGLANVKYVFAESKDVNQRPENRVTVTFAGERQGLASLLAGPSPMGTLDFVSPGASVAASFVLKDPKTLLERFLDPAAQANPMVRQALDVFQSETGVSLENDLAASFGGEVTVAQDGALLPTPQWIAVMDVYNPGGLQTSIEKLVKAFDDKLSGFAGNLRLTQEKAGGRVYYDLCFVPARPGAPSSGALASLRDLRYTFADGYLLVASSRSELERAIENYQTGYSLAGSAEFQAHLPEDGNAYFSALLYENLGGKLRPLLQELQGTGGAPRSGQSSLAELARNASPLMIGAYGEPDRIVLASNQSPLGLGLNSILGAATAILRRPAGRSGPQADF